MLKKDVLLGGFYATLAFTLWGFLPMYWKLLAEIPATEILDHRMIWSLIFCLVIFKFIPHAHFYERVVNKKTLLSLSLNGLIIGGNWLIYIWAVNSNFIVQCSLGYYISPLLSVVLGVVILKEQLSQAQLVSVVLASLGVAYLTWDFGEFPWIALSLSFTFGCYGLIRKLIAVGAIEGLMVETAILFLPALFYFFNLESSGSGHFLKSSWETRLLLIGAGPATALPLLWFAAAAKRLKLSTLGFYQYIAPSIQLLLGVFIYGEPFTFAHQITFTLIWVALALYSWDSIKRLKRNHTV